MKRKTPAKRRTSAPDHEAALYESIRELVVSARRTVVRGVDLVQVRTNSEIGRHIVEYEQRGTARAAYGQTVLKNLAEKLTREFGRGFSKSNLEYMRRFYLLYPSRVPIAQTETGQSRLAGAQIAQFGAGQSVPAEERGGSFHLGWTYYVFLMGIENPPTSVASMKSRRPLRDGTWLSSSANSTAALYERLALSRDKAGIRKLAQKGQLLEKPQDFLKEPMVLEFLGLGEQARYTESDLETAIINRIEHFLLEFGKGFLFEARQKRFTFGDDHFFVDLVFSNRLLRCYVLIDLKIGQLTHQDLGQMQMYVNYFDRHVRTEGENATIGIVLCKKKNGALVEITLPREANIHAREYQLYLPSKGELRQKLQEWAEEAEGE